MVSCQISSSFISDVKCNNYIIDAYALYIHHANNFIDLKFAQ